MFKELKKLLLLRKLWILRLYIALITFIVEFLLGAYVLVSIYYIIESDNSEKAVTTPNFSLFLSNRSAEIR